MKRLLLICTVVCISCIASQADEKSSAKKYQSARAKTGSRINAASRGSSKTSSSRSPHGILRKKHAAQIKLLNDIHEHQRKILQETLLNPGSVNKADFNKPTFRADLRYKLKHLPANLSQYKRFAFLDKMHIIDQVAIDISTGRIKYEKCKDTDPVKVLKYIQRKQKAALRNLQKKESARRE